MRFTMKRIRDSLINLRLSLSVNLVAYQIYLLITTFLTMLLLLFRIRIL